MKPIRSSALLVVSLALFSCTATRALVGIEPQPAAEESPSKSTFPWSDSHDPTESPLYSHDGGIVEAQDPGSVRPGALPRHDMAPTGTGRMHIVELYQQAIDERDELQVENDTLIASLDQLQVDMDALTLAAKTHDAAVAALRGENQRLMQQNLELASRLATAQLRRLEAERILLETKLAWLEPRAATPEPEARAVEEPSSNNPAASQWDMALQEPPQ